MRQAGAWAPLYAARRGTWEHTGSTVCSSHGWREAVWAGPGGRSMGIPEQEAGMALTGE